MAHEDIYTKFMIDYDKANVTSSYPSLTKYEAATILDKSYNALIAQKVTGNNVRRAYFESDTKSISDLAPLVVTESLQTKEESWANVTAFKLPDNFAYYVSAKLDYSVGSKKPYDKYTRRTVPVRLIPHQIAEKFIVSSYNMPWIKNPVCYVENGKIYVLFDPINKPLTNNYVRLSYIKLPNSFVENINKPTTTFELSDTMANELVSLAVAFALDNVESTRLNQKLNVRGLEA